MPPEETTIQILCVENLCKHVVTTILKIWKPSGLTWGDESPEPADGVDVPVADTGHGDDGPVQRGGHRVEHGALLVLLTHICQAWGIRL